MKKEYELYGPEWEKEMMKIPKKFLINLLKDEYMKNVPKEPKGTQKSPFGPWA